MSTIDGSTVSTDVGNVRLITFGVVLVAASLLLSGWLLLGGDLPGGLSALLLTAAGGLFVAIGSSEQSGHLRS